MSEHTVMRVSVWNAAHKLRFWSVKVLYKYFLNTSCTKQIWFFSFDVPSMVLDIGIKRETSFAFVSPTQNVGPSFLPLYEILWFLSINTTNNKQKPPKNGK